MRRALLLGLLLAACADDPAPVADAPRAADEAWPVDGFLAHLPENTSIVLRLPPSAEVAERRDVFVHALSELGWTGDPAALLYGAAAPEGLDRDRAPGLAVTTAGAWIHYLPAENKALLNRALAGRRDVTTREEGDWVLLAKAGATGQSTGDPLPPGDFGLGVRHHPLLAVLAQPGDTLEVGLEVGGRGLLARGRLRPGKATATRACLADARPGAGDLLDLIPSGVGIRAETTLPPAFLAGFVTRRLARHAGIADLADRAIVERLLRELLTGVDPDTGLAIGIEFHEGKATVVFVGKRGSGPDSAILARVRRDARSSFGPVVLDKREAPAGVLGWWAWLVEPEPRVDGLPETAVEFLLPALREDEGMHAAYLERNEWFACALGPRADLLVRAVRGKLIHGGRRSPGSFDLLDLRQRGDGDYVLGIVVTGPGLAAMNARDRAGLAALLGAGPDAQAPRSLALAGFRKDGDLQLAAHLRFAR